MIRFDFDGHGRSPLTGPVSIGALADDVGAVLDHVGVDTAHVIGHSAGTIVAQDFASRNPDRTAKLVLLGPIRELPDAGRAGLRDRAATVREQTIGAIATAVATAGTGAGTKADRPEIIGYVRESVLGQTDEGYAVACEAAAASVDAEQALITGPVLVITGSDDATAPPEKSERIAAGFADSEFAVIDGIGHWTVIEAGKQVSGLIAEFLR